MIAPVETRLICCTFTVGELWCGVDVRDVQEVVRSLPVTSVPMAGADICGLANLRGRIITSIDLPRRLHQPEPGDSRKSAHLVTKGDGEHQVSLRVHAVGDIIELDGSELDTPPDTLQGPVRDHLRYVAKLPPGLLLLLDTDSLIASGFR